MIKSRLNEDMEIGLIPKWGDRANKRTQQMLVKNTWINTLQKHDSLQVWYQVGTITKILNKEAVTERSPQKTQKA